MKTLSNEVRHISIFINNSPENIYTYVSNPANLPRWAKGLSGSITQENGEWIADSPMGKIKVRFAEQNNFGVLDHAVELPSGEIFNNPMRVVANGDGSELTFTLIRHPDMSEEKFQQDAQLIQDDLKTLKDLLESEN